MQLPAAGVPQLVRILRKARNVSQQDLADMSGLSRGTINHIESYNQEISLFQFLKIMQAFEVKVNIEMEPERELGFKKFYEPGQTKRKTI